MILIQIDNLIVKTCNTTCTEHVHFMEFPEVTEKPEDFEPNIIKACLDGKLSSVQYLIEKKGVDKATKVERSDVTKGFFKGDTPIHAACQTGQLSVVQYLVEKQHVDLEIKSGSSSTPLHVAAMNGYLPIVEYLVSKGANINATDVNGNTPLHTAVGNGHKDVAQFLIQKGAKQDIKNTNGFTPSDLASKVAMPL